MRPPPRRAPHLEPIPVFHIGRCGSTLLERMVHQHPKVIADGEVFHDTMSPWHTQYPTLSAAEYLVQRQSDLATQSPDSRIYTFDIKFLPGLDLKHFKDDYGALTTLMVDMGVTKAVVLKRRNVLRRIVSTLMAVKRGQYHPKPQDVIVPTTVTVPLDRIFLGRPYTLEEAIDGAETGYAAFAESLRGTRIDLHEMRYEEDLMRDPLQGYHKFLTLSGLPPAPCDIPLKRIQTEALSDVVENYAALEHRLDGTRHAWMLTAE